MMSDSSSEPVLCSSWTLDRCSSQSFNRSLKRIHSRSAFKIFFHAGVRAEDPTFGFHLESPTDTNLQLLNSSLQTLSGETGLFAG